VGRRPEGEYHQDVEDEVHGRIAEEEADWAAANQSTDQKQGRSLLLVDELGTAVQVYVENIWKLGGIVNTANFLGGAEAITADGDT